MSIRRLIANLVRMPQGGYLDQLVRYRSVLSFGAKGDGVTDDSTAFNAAFSSGDKFILIPAGYDFYINGKVGSLTTTGIQWVGSPGCRVLIGPNGGFDTAGLNWGFSNINFIPTTTNTPYAIKSGTLNSNRDSYIKDCSFRGRVTGHKFAVAIDLYNVWYSKFDNLYINNSGNADFSQSTFGGVGLRFNYCVNNTVTSCKIGSCDVGLQMSGTPSPVGLLSSQFACEGIVVSGNTLIANKCNLDVREGYFIDVHDNVIDIPLASTVNPVYFTGMCCRLSNNWISVAKGQIYVGKGESGLTSYDGTGNSVDGNVIRASSGATHDLMRVGPVGILSIKGNQFFFGGYAIKSDGGSNWQLSDNFFSAQATGAYDTHLTSMVRIGPNKVYSSMAKPVKSVSPSSVLSPTLFSGNVSVTLSETPLTSGGVVTQGQTFYVPLPTGVFTGAPTIAVATLATGSTMGVARYVRGESSSTALVFNYVGVGSPIAAGSYNFSIMAVDNDSAF